MSPVLVFDCDGVLADTERFGHLPSFNRMWGELGVPWQWSDAEYGRKLKIGGGKERMLSLFEDPAFLRAWPQAPSSPAARKELVAAWHKRKSEIYRDIVSSGRLPSRSGVRRLAQEALGRGWLLAVASTSAVESVEAVLRQAVGEATASRFSLVLAGDCVRAKKPAPDIYLLVSERLGVPPSQIVAIEDSANGVEAAVSAGMHTVVTLSGYTVDEDFSKAVLVLSCLGDPGGETCTVLGNRSRAHPRDWLTVGDLEAVLQGG